MTVDMAKKRNYYTFDTGEMETLTDAILVNRGRYANGDMVNWVCATIVIDGKSVPASEWVDINPARLDTLIGMLEMAALSLKDYADAAREANKLKKEMGL